MTAKELLSKID
jgi:hypothetical protein